jgi:hypothetical protein
MTVIRYAQLRAVKPFAWAGALLFFVITEALVIAAEKYHRLSSGHPFHSWLLPIICTAPLIVGYNFSGGFGKKSGDSECEDIAVEKSASIAILLFASYSVLTSVVAVLNFG